MTIVVEAPARLHFGMLDLRGDRGRRFGGVGAAVPTPSVLVSANLASDITIVADDDTVREAATRAARRFLDRYAPGCGPRHGVTITIHRTLPAHHGLGSGTQHALAVAAAIDRLYELGTSIEEMAAVVGRAQRSAIGTYVFARGGCILDGGRLDGSPNPAPLLSHLPIPAEWRCVLALPSGNAGISGTEESRAFGALPPPPEGDAERVAHLVLMQMWPALAEHDFERFAAGLTELQQINGRWFAPAQGGPFATGPSTALIAQLMKWGAQGVGQSSWGPAVYALTPDADAGQALASRVRTWLDTHGGGSVYEGPFSHTGAKISIVGA